MSTSLVIYIDVDNTLIRKGPHGEEIPQLHVVAHIRDLNLEGATLYCWSTGGKEHALCTARRLGIEDCFQGFLHKPQAFLDDEEARVWPHFVHIHPDHLGSYRDYQSAVALKMEG